MSLRASQLPGWYNVSPDLYEQCKLVPGRRAAHGVLQLHRTHLPLVDDADAARVCALPSINMQVREARDRRTAGISHDPSAPQPFKLRSYQHDAVDFVERCTHGALIGDEPRLGKTVTALMTHDPSLGRLVIISPLMVREVWLGWIRRVFPGEDIGVMAGKKFDKEVASKPIVVGHPALLPTWGTDMPVGTLILDEAHDYSNYKSRRSVGASMIASRSKRVVALTGTPVYNKIIGMWFLLSLLEPGAWGSYDDFGKRYCGPEYTEWGPRYVGSSNSDELSQRLTQIMIRRRHAEIRDDLPPMARETIIADLTPAQRRQIDFAAEGLRKSARTNTAGELARYRAAIGAAKVDTTVEYGMKILRRDEPLVVWAWHKATAKHLEVAFREAGATTFMVHGDVTPVARREELITAWKAAPPSVLIITIAIGQVGIDLSHAQYALVVEIDYTPALMEQMEMRIFNASRPSYLTYIVVDHMTDRRMAIALIAKLTKTKPLDMQAAEQMINLLEVMFGEPADGGDMNRLMLALLEHEEGVV